MSISRADRLAAFDMLDDSAAAVLHDWFACSEALVGDAFITAADRFCKLESTTAASIRDIAARWAACLATALEDTIAPRYAAEILEYETIVADLSLSDGAARDASLAATRNAACPRPVSAGGRITPATGRHVRLARFQFNAPAIAYAIETCDRLGDLEQPSPRIVLFVRQPTEPRISIMDVSDGIEMLLRHCNGVDDVASIIDRIERDAAAGTDLPGQAIAALQALQLRNAISNAKALDQCERA